MIAKNVMNVLRMSNNLIPPFIIRDSGLIVNDILNTHAKFPTNEHHSIYDASLDVSIPLSLTGTFSYFKTRSLKSYGIKTVMNMT